MNRKNQAVFALAALVCLSGTRAGWAQGELERMASWGSPRYADLREQTLSWSEGTMFDEAIRGEVQALWPAEGPAEVEVELLDRLVRTFAVALPAARELVEHCQQARPRTLAPKFSILADEAQPTLVRANLSLYYARWLVQHEMYDEALDVIGTLPPEDVAAPATLLFHQSVAHHRLLQKEACLPKLAKLLENEAQIPRRYREVSRLMEADLRPLKPDTLDEVSRIMDNVQRRLDLGRAGKRVRKEEDDVIAKLDKMIEELEKQQQQQQSGGGGGGSGQAPQNPAQDSVPAGGSGPGNVAQKNIGRSAGWGNLPPKEREEAMQEITKNLPAHYREVIEEYFRKLARSGN